MVFVGSDDGVYRVDEDGVAQTFGGGRVMRLRRPDGVEGLFAATTEGLYHSVDGEAWRDLGLDEQVYAVGVGPDGERLYAGTRPAALYVADGLDGDWTALPGFQELPSRDEWRLPRHENLAQVRDVLADGADRLVAGVEVGGVHVSTDGGATWTERRDSVDDDVHELHVRGQGEYAAATGGGLYTSEDAGRTWTRLDEGVDQWYFRRVIDVGGTLYAAGAIAPSGTWNDPDADPALFAYDGDPATPAAARRQRDGDGDGGGRRDPRRRDPPWERPPATGRRLGAARRGADPGRRERSLHARGGPLTPVSPRSGPARPARRRRRPCCGS